MSARSAPTHEVRDGEEIPTAVPKSVVAYITQWCPDCSRSRRLLQRLGISFQEIDIEKVVGAEDEMRARNGGSGKIPTIVIGDTVLVEPSDLEIRRALADE